MAELGSCVNTLAGDLQSKIDSALSQESQESQDDSFVPRKTVLGTRAPSVGPLRPTNRTIDLAESHAHSLLHHLCVLIQEGAAPEVVVRGSGIELLLGLLLVGSTRIRMIAIAILERVVPVVGLPTMDAALHTLCGKFSLFGVPVTYPVALGILGMDAANPSSDPKFAWADAANFGRKPHTFIGYLLRIASMPYCQSPDRRA